MGKNLLLSGSVFLFFLVGCQTEEQISGVKSGNQEATGSYAASTQAARITDWQSINARCLDVAFSPSGWPPYYSRSFLCVDRGPLGTSSSGQLYQYVYQSPGHYQKNEFWGPESKPVFRVAANNRNVAVIGYDKRVYLLDQANGIWIVLAGSSNGVDVSVGPSGSIQYVGGTNYTLYYWDGYSWIASKDQYGTIQTGLRLSATTNGTILNSTGNKLWRIYPNSSGKVTSEFMGATSVNDVCGSELYGTPGNIVMHSGSGYINRLSGNSPSYTWTRLGGDYNTQNIDCNGNVGTGIVVQTNTSGDAYWKEF
jgi:hypothetical protein